MEIIGEEEMKVLTVFAILAISLTLIAAGCQTMSSIGGVVSARDSVGIPAGEGSGQWKGNDLVVDYKYSRTPGAMDMTGVIRFDDHITYNFIELHRFHLSALLLDEKGKVLEDQGVTTDRGDFQPIPFHVRLAAPASVASLAFSYEGTAITQGEEGGDATRFWQYPIHH